MNKNFVESFVEECYRAGLTELQTMVALEKSASDSTGRGIYEYGANSAEEEAAIRSLLTELYNGNLQFVPSEDIFTDPVGITTDFLEDNAGAFINALLGGDIYQGKKYYTNPLSSTKYLINFPRNMEARRVRQRNRVYDLLRVSDDGLYHGESADRIHAKLDIGDVYAKYEKAWQTHHDFEKEIARNIKDLDAMIADPNTPPNKKAAYEESKQTYLLQRKQNDAKLAEAKKTAEVEMALLTNQHNRTNSSSEAGGMTPIRRATHDRLATLEQKRNELARLYKISNGSAYDIVANPGTYFHALTKGDAEIQAEITALDEQIYALRQSLNEQEEYERDVASDYGREDMQAVHNSIHTNYTGSNPDIDYSFLAPASETQPDTTSTSDNLWGGVKDRLRQLVATAQSYRRNATGTQPTAAPVTPPSTWGGLKDSLRRVSAMAQSYGRNATSTRPTDAPAMPAAADAPVTPPTLGGGSETTVPVEPPTIPEVGSETTVPIKPEAEALSDSSIVPPPPSDIPEDEEELTQ